MPGISQLNDSDFSEQVLKSKVPVIIDFWAEWCAPCRMIAPILEEISKEYEGKIRIFKLDVDSNSDTPSQYAVTSIPTLILFKDGSPVDKVIGAVSKNKIKSVIDSVI